MHILVLTQNDIAAPKYGGALRVAFLIEQLLEQGHHVSVIRFRSRSAPASLSSARLPIHDVVVPRGYAVAPIAAITHLLSRATERIARMLQRARPIDLVQSDPPWAALTGDRVASQLGVPHVLLAQNCETALAAEFAKTGPALRLPLIGQQVSDFNVGVVRWAERRTITRAVLTLTPSIHDSAEMAAIGIQHQRIQILPNGTNVHPSAPGTRQILRARLGLATSTPTVVFVGRMDYPPNRDAITLICTRIAPACPGVTFLLVGLNPPQIRTPANVMLIGAVDSIDDYLGASDLSIVPILQGSGTRIKILDAWAAGLPVLSTAAGASGLEYQEGVHIAIENDIERFPQRILELLRDPAQRAQLQRGALAAATPYRWETIGRRYIASLQSLVGGS
jgi:glycosyltransferase involved in cell wall biosynthesis